MPTPRVTNDHRTGLTAQSTASGNQEYITSTSGILNVNASVTPTGTQDVNNKQVNGVTVSTGNGTTDTGTQRVTISSDSTGQIRLTDGTDVADITTGDSGNNGQVVVPARKEVTFTTTTVQAVGITDVSNYNFVSLHIVTQGGSSTVTYQGSNDNTNWVSASLMTVGSVGTSQAATSTTSAGVILQGPISFRYFRLNVTGIVSGTTAGVLEFKSIPPAVLTTTGTASQIGTWTVGSNSATGSAVPANGFYIAANNETGNLNGVRLTAAPVDGSGLVSAVHSLAAGYVYNGSTYDRVRAANTGQNTTGTGVAAAAMLAWDGTNYQRFPAATFAPSTTALNTYAIRITSNATTTPTSSTAYISSITITSEIAGTTSTVTIQDKQGTPLKLVNGFTTTAITTAPQTINFQTPVKMTSGIDIITAGAVAATVDVWVNYYQ